MLERINCCLGKYTEQLSSNETYLISKADLHRKVKLLFYYQFVISSKQCEDDIDKNIINEINRICDCDFCKDCKQTNIVIENYIEDNSDYQIGWRLKDGICVQIESVNTGYVQSDTLERYYISTGFPVLDSNGFPITIVNEGDNYIAPYVDNCKCINVNPCITTTIEITTQEPTTTINPCTIWNNTDITKCEDNKKYILQTNSCNQTQYVLVNGDDSCIDCIEVWYDVYPVVTRCVVNTEEKKQINSCGGERYISNGNFCGTTTTVIPTTTTTLCVPNWVNINTPFCAGTNLVTNQQDGCGNNRNYILAENSSLCLTTSTTSTTQCISNWVNQGSYYCDGDALKQLQNDGCGNLRVIVLDANHANCMGTTTTQCVANWVNIGGPICNGANLVQNQQDGCGNTRQVTIQSNSGSCRVGCEPVWNNIGGTRCQYPNIVQDQNDGCGENRTIIVVENGCITTQPPCTPNWTNVGEAYCAGTNLVQYQVDGCGNSRNQITENHVNCVATTEQPTTTQEITTTNCIAMWADAQPNEFRCSGQVQEKKQQDGCGNIRWIGTGNNSSCIGETTTLEPTTTQTPSLSMLYTQLSCQEDNVTSLGKIDIFNPTSGSTLEYRINGNSWIAVTSNPVINVLLTGGVQYHIEVKETIGQISNTVAQYVTPVCSGNTGTRYFQALKCGSFVETILLLHSANTSLVEGDFVKVNGQCYEIIQNDTYNQDSNLNAGTATTYASCATCQASETTTTQAPTSTTTTICNTCQGVFLDNPLGNPAVNVEVINSCTTANESFSLNGGNTYSQCLTNCLYSYVKINGVTVFDPFNNIINISQDGVSISASGLC